MEPCAQGGKALWTAEGSGTWMDSPPPFLRCWDSDSKTVVPGRKGQPGPMKVPHAHKTQLSSLLTFELVAWSVGGSGCFPLP